VHQWRDTPWHLRSGVRQKISLGYHSSLDQEEGALQACTRTVGLRAHPGTYGEDPGGKVGKEVARESYAV